MFQEGTAEIMDHINAYRLTVSNTYTTTFSKTPERKFEVITFSGLTLMKGQKFSVRICKAICVRRPVSYASQK